VQAIHPSSTKNTNQNSKIFVLKKQLASNSRAPEQNTYNQMPIQTIQNITNYHIDMPQQIILNGEDGRSLDRIIDQS